MKLKKLIAAVGSTAMLASMLASCGGTSSGEEQKEAVKEAEGTAKEDLPLSKYPETVTVHLGGSIPTYSTTCFRSAVALLSESRL